MSDKKMIEKVKMPEGLDRMENEFKDIPISKNKSMLSSDTSSDIGPAVTKKQKDFKKKKLGSSGYPANFKKYYREGDVPGETRASLAGTEEYRDTGFEWDKSDPEYKKYEKWRDPEFKGRVAAYQKKREEKKKMVDKEDMTEEKEEKEEKPNKLKPSVGSTVVNLMFSPLAFASKASKKNPAFVAGRKNKEE